MPYHTPQLTCGCGKNFPLHDFMKQKDVHIPICCENCGTLFEVTLHVPKDLLIQDAVQRAEFERIHGPIK